MAGYGGRRGAARRVAACLVVGLLVPSVASAAGSVYALNSELGRVSTFSIDTGAALTQRGTGATIGSSTTSTPPAQNHYFPLTQGLTDTYRWTNPKVLSHPEVEKVTIATVANSSARFGVQSVSGPLQTVGDYGYTVGTGGVTEPPPVSWSQVVFVVVAVDNRRLSTVFSRAYACVRARARPSGSPAAWSSSYSTGERIPSVLCSRVGL